MSKPESIYDREQAGQQILGYLNFSSGASDPKVLAAFSQLYECVETRDEEAPWVAVWRTLETHLTALAGESGAFAEPEQARAVLRVAAEVVLPAYRSFHEDLLFHQTDRDLFGPFFVGRVCEAILAVGPPWDEDERLSSETVAKLNDFIGYRPVAVLENKRVEPYSHEWVRPIPIYVRGAGAALGKYRRVVNTALQLLKDTDSDILRAAQFDPELMDELAIDPRAYDFDHPVNKRPNYHFGQWDPHQIDNQGRYRRFVIQHVTLDTLMSRLQQGSLPADELEYEAAAVLAGTMLMAAGTSGRGPEAHSSDVTLGTLLPQIADYRDAFYERLIEGTESQHRARLIEEAAELRQPFGGARQHLNAELARRRASQLEHVHLARVFARMGHAPAANKQVEVIPVVSARLACWIDCLLCSGNRGLDTGDLEAAEEVHGRAVDLLRRGIECGAFVDPWNILGFDCHFSLFPALENSMYDHRVDELIETIERMMAFCSRLWGEAAVANRNDLCERIDREFRETAEWWRQYAAHTVNSVECADALDV